MKKILIIFLISFIVTGCTKVEHKINIAGKTLENDFIEIYSWNEKEKIYSTFTEIDFFVDKQNKISLTDAFEKNLITVEEIISHMECTGMMNDGGSLIYKYSVNDKNKFANQDFILVKCNSLEINGGIKNIYIGNDEKLVKHCVI